MQKHLILSFLLTLITIVTFAQKKPNIILILSDDAGYADFSFQSNRFISTPNIDRIAKEGAMFTNAYVTGAVCSPSRAGLLTGINQPEFGTVGNFVQGVKYNIPMEEFGIPLNIPLVGDYLKPLGYKTGIIGKWHEGFDKKHQPNSRGFDYFWGFLWGSSTYTSGKAKGVLENGQPIAPETIPYMTDAIGDKSIEFIKREKDNPFFLYVSFNAVHTPQQAKEEDIAAFSSKFIEKKRMMNAAMTHSLDENVGRIFKQLEDLHLLENTIVIFTNDNGGQITTLSADNYPLRGMKGNIYEGGIRVPMAIRWPEKIKAGTVSNTPVTTLDFMPTMIDAAGGKASNFKVLKGSNLSDIVTNGKKYKKRKLYWRTGFRTGALRIGDWKIIYQEGLTPSLYNLTKDIAETNDLSKDEPKIMQSMLNDFMKWYKNLPPVRFYPLNQSADVNNDN